MSDPRADLGVFVQPGLATAWPELRDILGRIYSDKVQTLPWIPRDWLGRVQALEKANTGALVRIAGPFNGAPTWADSAAKQAAWSAIADQANSAVYQYSIGKAAAGRAELETLYAKAAFWNSAYSIAVAIRDLPANLVGGALSGAGDVAGGILKKLFSSWLVWVALLGGGGFLAWRLGLLRFSRKGK